MTKRRRLPKYVVEYEVPKGSGKWFVYFRRPGQKDVRMRAIPYSDEFNAQYHALLAGEEPPENKAPAPVIDGTFGSLCADYLAAMRDSGDLDARTLRVRQGILESCMDEVVSPGSKKTFRDVPLPQFGPKAVAVLRDRKNGKPQAANGRVKAIRAVFGWACHPEVMKALSNPARDVQYKQGNNPDGFHTWTVEEVEQFEERHPVGTKARLALALLLYTAQRRSDIVLLGKQHERDGWLKFTQQKNKRKKPVAMEIPIWPELRTTLDASPVGDIVYLVNDFGKPFSANGFGNWFRKRCDEAGLKHCSAHGLRKAAATRLADAGASPHEIMAITGHKTLKEVERYTRAASQKRLAKAASERR